VLRDVVPNMSSQVRRQSLPGQIKTLNATESCVYALWSRFKSMPWRSPRIHGTSISNSYVFQTLSWSKAERLHARRDDGDGQPIPDRSEGPLLLRDAVMVPIVSV